ncbi:MAG: ATP-binding protein [Aeromicrobium erythreum]
MHARPATAVRLDVVAAAGLEVGFAAELLERTVAPVLDNAVRHARTQVDVVVRGHGDRVLVEVRDDGPGLALDRVDEVFGVGVRGGGDGTGLGLALARRVARTVGGAVEVTSPSDPTVFTIDLPRT